VIASSAVEITGSFSNVSFNIILNYNSVVPSLIEVTNVVEVFSFLKHFRSIFAEVHRRVFAVSYVFRSVKY
jgi:hypothetical protein